MTLRKILLPLTYSTVYLLAACGRPAGHGLDVQERIQFRRDGSGTCTMAADLCSLRKYLRLSAYFTKQPAHIIQQIDQQVFKATAQRLLHIAGISKVTTARDFKKLRFKITFQFQNIPALNHAMHKLLAPVDSLGFTYFSMQGHVLHRADTSFLTQLLSTHLAEDNPYLRSFDLRTFLRNLTYTTVYTFDRRVHHVDNSYAKISTRRRSVQLAYTPLCRCKGHPTSVAQSIHFSASP